MKYNLCQITRKMWHYFLMHSIWESFDELAKHCSRNIVIIGTDRHEFYTSLHEAIGQSECRGEMKKEKTFEIIDENYKCLELSDNIHMVYGNLWIKEKMKDENQTLNTMDTRFSVIYKVGKDSCELIHIHHSVPYSGQDDNGYYPKALTEKAYLLINEFKEKAERDMMTGLLNHVAFKEYVNESLHAKLTGFFCMIDIDHFKLINDKFGHEQGDIIIAEFADLLRTVFDASSYLGRLGGDEFAVFIPDSSSEEYVKQKAHLLISNFSRLSEKYRNGICLSCSIGIASAGEELSNFNLLYRNADKNLYLSKKCGRGTFRINNEE